MKSAKAPLLDRILDPVARSLNVEAAHSLLTVRVDAEDQARVAKLAEKCNQGKLTDTERLEYDNYVWTGKIVAILQAKAKVILAEAASRSKAT